MPKKFPAEVHERAVRMVLDRSRDYPTVFAACTALAPKLNFCVETSRK
jgi:transposase